VALLDSGVSTAAGASRPSVSCRFFLEAGEIATAPALPDRHGHGARIAAIVSEESDGVPVAFLDGQIFRERLVTTPRVAAAALDWAIARRARVVGMSFGLRDDRDVLRDACRRAVAADAVLVSAAPTRGGPVFPASYPGVIRAVADARCAPREVSDFKVTHTFGASPAREEGASAEATGGSSFACARVLAAVIRLLWLHPGWSAADLVRGLAAAARHRGPQRGPAIDGTPRLR